MMIAGDGMIEDQVGQQLLERDHELQVLESTLTEATAGSGSVVVIAGNAGMGKSALVSEWTRRAGRTARILVGWCDDLATSRTLGPFHDIARHVGGDLAEAVAAGDIRRGLEALLQELQNPLRPTVLIIEDVHWADDATLDVVRYLGRRIGPLPAVLVLTHRQDDIGSHHPLRAVLGVLPSRLVRRLELDPLSEDAVATLVRGTGLDGPATMELTGGNPFFVTELARSGGTTPVSVADAIVARVQALTGPTRDALARLSVSPRPIPLDDALELVDADGLRIAEDRGFLVVVRGRIGFAHELARRAVLSSLTQVARMRHHAAHLDHLLGRWSPALTALEHPFELGRADRDANVVPGLAAHEVSTLQEVRAAVLDHAAALGRAELVAMFAPGAAHDAFVADAHSQALAHQHAALAVADRIAPDVLAALYLERAWSLHNRNRFSEAVQASTRAAEQYAELGDTQSHCRVLLTRSRLLWLDRQVGSARAVLDEAATLVSDCEPFVEVEWLVNRLAFLHLTNQHDEVITTAPEIAARAREVDRADLVAHTENYAGGSQVLVGDVDTGLARVRRAIERADRAGWLEAAARARVNLGDCQVEARRWDDVGATIDETLAFCDDHDLPGPRVMAMVQRATVAMSGGDWTVADAVLGEVEPGMADAGHLGATVLQARARLAVRSGAEDADAVVRRAWAQAEQMRGAAWVVPGACAAAELAWAHGRPRDGDAPLHAALAVAGTTLHLEPVLLRFALVGLPLPADVDPAAVHGALSPETWAMAQMPWEQALALCCADEETELLEALAILDGLDAGPAARVVRQRLRTLGVTAIPRGPRASTRENPAGLTDRQLDVLELVADELTNAEIADRLVLSVRTVDHHVSAVLRKLGASSRREAAAIHRTGQFPGAV